MLFLACGPCQGTDKPLVGGLAVIGVMVCGTAAAFAYTTGPIRQIVASRAAASPGFLVVGPLTAGKPGHLYRFSGDLRAATEVGPIAIKPKIRENIHHLVAPIAPRTFGCRYAADFGALV
jgi:hypothetical protein